MGQMRTADFDFALPPELIAQKPAARRDESRLLVLHRDSGEIEHRKFRDLLNFLRSGDALVLNNSRVIPARLHGIDSQTGGQFEMLLVEENGANDWWAMVRPAKRARIGTKIRLVNRRSPGDETQFQIRNPKSEIRSGSEPPCVGSCNDISALVTDRNDEGHRRLQFEGVSNIADALDDLGETPLPPYIHRDGELPEDRERYQTVFAANAGSVAAPTAGLHFTEPLLEDIRASGVEICFVTLHVGPGTFLPVKTETLAAHKMHEERYELSAETARVISHAKAAGRRIIAVGTTTVRVLESVAEQGRAGSPLPAASPNVIGSAHGVARPTVAAAAGRTSIFIHPPSDFKVVDALLTNFHLPHSTLLMLVSAFAAPSETRGREMILSAYAAAVRARYRFFSYGDAMLIF
jgi:S-adenosylmethionine:tRNA ribosyltransferase-isomerase